MADNEVISEIIEEMGKVAETLGLPTVTAKAWTTLYFKGDMTQEQLKNELRCGLSTISQSLKLLEKLGLVNTFNKDGRKNIYCAENSFDKIKRKKLEAILLYAIDPMTSMLNNRIDLITNKETKNKAKELKDSCSKMGTGIRMIIK
jgi:DNA-binding transcriptional regulator GbsR (MarR family)